MWSAYRVYRLHLYSAPSYNKRWSLNYLYMYIATFHFIQFSFQPSASTIMTMGGLEHLPYAVKSMYYLLWLTNNTPAPVVFNDTSCFTSIDISVKWFVSAHNENHSPPYSGGNVYTFAI